MMRVSVPDTIKELEYRIERWNQIAVINSDFLVRSYRVNGYYYSMIKLLSIQNKNFISIEKLYSLGMECDRRTGRGVFYSRPIGHFPTWVKEYN